MSVIVPVIALSILYVIALFGLRRRRRRPVLAASGGLFFVVIVPCLNEELVIEGSLQRLLAFPPDRMAVLVIDDGSDDNTGELVRTWMHTHPSAWMLTRRAPAARRGKGEALNAGYRYLRDSSLLGGRRPQDVVLVVLDADGRIQPNALDEVAGIFRDPEVGAVQIGVRMYNAEESILARLQDFEFVAFTEIFQRARQRLGSVGLGGNGQFTRLSALADLGDQPWTDCLTEDLDLGIRLLVAGHSNSFCPTTWVSQQAVTLPRRLLRQRTRWFQGHLQCLRRIPMILRSGLPLKPSMDLIQHLMSPLLVLLTSVLPVLLVIGVVGALVHDPGGLLSYIFPPTPLALLVTYLLGFGLSPLYGFAYWLRDGRISFLRALAIAHAYSLYTYLWFAAGWLAVLTIARGQRGWAKTARTVPAPDEDAPAAVVDLLHVAPSLAAAPSRL
ncbi:MAG: glycosyltransferase family 2 protein [Mycobacteriales bacterium]